MKLSRRRALFAAAGALTASGSTLASLLSQGSAQRRNFIIILADDQGYQDLGCFGSPNISTPRIDRMAAEGMKFTNFYSQPLCGPARTALLTGCYPMRVAEFGNEKRGFPYIHSKEILLPKVLQAVGYATGMVGKLDITSRAAGYKPELNPVNRGFDSWYGVVGANDDGFATGLYRNLELLAAKAPLENLTQDYTAEALGFIRKNRDKPFFLYLAHTMPHMKIAASSKFVGVSKRGLYGDVVQELDWSTGQIVDLLHELKLDRNTIIVYTSDNGPWNRHVELAKNGEAGTATPLRNGKSTTWEGGMREPCVMWGPGHIPAGKTCKEVATTMDLLPTFIKLAGAKLPGDRVIDGKDISPLMTAQPAARSPHEALYYYSEAQLEAVRSGKWKLVLPRSAAKDSPWMARYRSYDKYIPNTFDAVADFELYDLDADVSESRNVADQHPDVVNRLKALAEKGRKELGDYRHIGAGVRFYEDGPKWPNLAKWRQP